MKSVLRYFPRATGAGLALYLSLGLSAAWAQGAGDESQQAQGDSPSEAQEGGAGASDPLSNTNNADLRWIYFEEEDGSETNLWVLTGGQGLGHWAKLTYWLSYAKTDDSGEVTQGFDILRLKPIFFVKKGMAGGWKYGMATGFEVILDFAEVDTGAGTIEGFGTGSDLFSPLFGVSFSKGKTTIVPLVQHYIEMSGDTDVSVTGFRLIAIRQFGKGNWTKADIIAPYDWNNEILTGTFKIELGHMFSPRFGAYFNGLWGYADSSIDWGASANFRFVY